jgi:hypothetical protein
MGDQFASPDGLPFRCCHSGTIRKLEILKYYLEIFSEAMKNEYEYRNYLDLFFRQDIDQILQRISFTDKIIFGRLNYNAHSTGYENHVEFYNDLCHQIREFCEKQGIRYYFKKGTLTKPLAILPMSIGLSTSAQRRAVELGRLF